MKSPYLHPLTKSRTTIQLSLMIWLTTLPALQAEDTHGDHAEEAEHNESHEAHGEHDDHGGESTHEGRDEHGHDGHDGHGQKDSESTESGVEHKNDTHQKHGAGNEHSDHEGSSDGHQEKAGREQGHEGHDDRQEGIVDIPEPVRKEFGIELGRASSGILHKTVTLPGEIKYNREQISHVTPRYSGVIQSIHTRIGDRVKKGEILARLESTDTLRPFEVSSPINGVVTRYDLTPGQTVAQGTTLFTVADLSTVWADIQIYQPYLLTLEEGMTVRVQSGHDQQTFIGKINYVAPTVDEHTRTGLARVVVSNADRTWKPGQFIKGVVSTTREKVALVIPHTAPIKVHGETAVFVRTEEGFQPRPVELGRSDAEHIEVLSGLKPGETIVIRNAISLKAEMAKGSFQGHSH